MINEDLIRDLTLEARKQLGPKATAEDIQNVVEHTYEKLERNAGVTMATDSGRIMLTAYGYNSPGILAAITKVLAQHDCDILDMTQKLLQEFFTLMMLVDITNSPSDFTSIKNDLVNVSESMKMRIIVQHEDLFNAMHRI